MNDEDQILDCLIIGSGIAGLTAGRILKEAGFSVILLDKGRGTGGRLATRRVGEKAQTMGIVDYGAPFFAPRTSRIINMLQDWEKLHMVKKWPETTVSGEPQKYIGSRGMRSVAIHLATSLRIIQSEKVIQMNQDSSWTVTTENGNKYRASILFITAPVPQSLALLDRNQIFVEETAREQLNRVEYDHCLSLFGLLGSSSQRDHPGANLNQEEPFQWIADHQRRGISALPAYTVHLSHTFSQQHWETPQQEIISQLSPEIMKKFGAPLKTIHLHRWKFANAKRTYPEAFFLQLKPLPMVLAGDGFGPGGIEGAVLSGLAAAEALLEKDLP